MKNTWWAKTLRILGIVLMSLPGICPSQERSPRSGIGSKPAARAQPSGPCWKVARTPMQGLWPDPGEVGSYEK